VYYDPADIQPTRGTPIGLTSMDRGASTGKYPARRADAPNEALAP